mgnify:CR=1 FL=1
MTSTVPAFDALERIFHEPNRLAIMSTLCGAGNRGMAFNEVKAVCKLTDGNLNRHLKVLEESGAIKIAKTFVQDKPRTTVSLSTQGIQRFHQYLEALAQVLKQAQKSLPAERPAASVFAIARKAAR